MVSPTPSYTITMTPLPTSTPETVAVLSHNVWRPLLNGDLHIGIKPPVDGMVTVHVFNAAAELVREPFKADCSAGITVDAVWDGSNGHGEACAAGVYVISVQGGGIKKLMKVILLK